MDVNKMQPRPKIFFVVNVDWFFLSHRLPLALEAQKRDYDVTIVTIETDRRAEIESYGFRFIGIPTSRAGTNPLQELKVLYFLLKLYRKEKPSIIHHVGVKPVTYGSVAAKLLRMPKVVNALSGMGYLFINKNNNRLAHRMVMSCFRYGFKNPRLRFILQNSDDLADVRRLNVLKDNQLFLIKGSGVDLDDYKFTPPPATGRTRILLPARMLWDKGVGEFVAAAQMLHPTYKDHCEFILAGNADMGNISGIPEHQLLVWQQTGSVSWIGFQDNMKEVLGDCHIVVLPSYREGLPKSLIEACAIGRPIVTTDVPGCREVVIDGENGFLVEVKNAEALAAAIEKLIIDPALRTAMGAKGRKIAEENFSIQSVIQQTFEIYNS